MNLVIDIGNTRTKAAVFKGYELISEISSEASIETIVDFIHEHHNDLECGILSSVSQVPGLLLECFNETGIPFIHLDAETPLPFNNTYKTKDTLGKDRIAALAGAMQLYPSQNILVIDAGTAITYDVLTAKGEYIGGNISPGITMRYKALNTFTARLPLLNNVKNTSLLGDSTSSAIENGVQNGVLYEVNGFIDEAYEKFPDLTIVLTGGDCDFFDNKLKKPIFVLSNMTLRGLNYILEYNAEKF